MFVFRYDYISVNDIMKRPFRHEDGYYHIEGKKYKNLFGSRKQVYMGSAYKTKGELVKDQFIMNKLGRIVSKKKHYTAKKEKRLEKYGYFAEKGKFGYVKKTPRHTKKRGGKQSEKKQINQKQQVDEKTEQKEE